MDSITKSQQAKIENGTFYCLIIKIIIYLLFEKKEIL